MKIRCSCLALILIALLEAFIPMGGGVILDTEVTTISTNVVATIKVDDMATSLNRDNYDPDPDSINIIVDDIVVKTNLATWYLKAEEANPSVNEGYLLEGTVLLQNYQTAGEGDGYENLETGVFTIIEGNKIGETPFAILDEQKGSWSEIIDLGNKSGERIKITLSSSA